MLARRKCRLVANIFSLIFFSPLPLFCTPSSTSILHFMGWSGFVADKGLTRRALRNVLVLLQVAAVI